ncbi:MULTISPECIES: FtsX-like permease family protein [unclassified Pseudoalteromonas]|uniref:ABC transporter permease n=1 Tax=unclassified Pseudoalteromonas TaxID=194690 RepID=UPI0020974C38|nr:FtsX-like permease family protein [Pseudoalteromonas sp. XMcav2-N]MCO7189746.1 FtsX-like permease family protein [Pseudoalteromonas sp. XMcav2-N]
MKDLKPILSTIWRSKSAPLLLILQIAVTFTILVNAVYLIIQKEALLIEPSGLDEEVIFTLHTNVQSSEAEEMIALVKQDLRDVRALPSVENVTVMNSFPLSDWGSYAPTGLGPSEEDMNIYTGYFTGDEHAIATMGLELIAGEGPSEGEVQDSIDFSADATQTVVSKGFAELYYPDDWRAILGTTVYLNYEPFIVKGVVKDLKSVWPGWYSHANTVLVPLRHISSNYKMLIRSRPGELEQAKQQVAKALMKTPGRHLDKMMDYQQIRADKFKSETAAIKTLYWVIVGLVLLTLLGIFGQARFTVVKRRKQIGTRRALGASRTDILRYCMAENAIVTSVGIVVGVICALLANVQLVNHFDMAPVPVVYLFQVAGVILIVGQLAVCQPAWMAARVSPALATRSV